MQPSVRTRPNPRSSRGKLAWMAVPLAAAALWLTPGAAPRAQSMPPASPAAPGLPGSQPAPGAGMQPRLPSGPAASRADLGRYAASVVRISAEIVRDGVSVEMLGANRVGTGVILDDRTVLTIGYLVMEAEKVEVTTVTGRRIPASVAGFDHSSGFGLLRTALPIDGMALELGDSDALGERTRVLTIGQGEPEATPLFVLSRKPFAGNWEYLVEKALYTFPPVNNWSGAALITEDGKLVGIGSLIVNDAAAGQAGVPGNMYVPTNLLKPVLAELRTAGKVPRAQPWLGLTTEVVRGNLMVTRVAPGGPAESAGVSAGDIVLGVGAEKVGDQADFYKRVWAVGPAGTEIQVRVLKDGDVRNMRIRSIDRSEFLRRPSGV